MRRWLTAALLIGLAACSHESAHNEATPSPTPTAPAIPAATSANGSAALPTPELAGVTTARGTWTVQPSAGGDQAAFGADGQPSLFTLGCDTQKRQIVFARAAASAMAKSMQIVASDGAATFPAEPAGTGRVQASDFVTDTFLTQVLATATGRIGVKLGDGPTLAMPADPVIGRTIKRCADPHG